MFCPQLRKCPDRLVPGLPQLLIKHLLGHGAWAAKGAPLGMGGIQDKEGVQTWEVRQQFFFHYVWTELIFFFHTVFFFHFNFFFILIYVWTARQRLATDVLSQTHLGNTKTL